MASLARKDVRSDGGTIPAAENDILALLEKDTESVEDTNKLCRELKSMRDDKGLIKLLKEKHISRMWEIAACKYSEIADLRAPNDPDVRARLATAVDAHAAAAINAMLPQAGQPHVKWIGKRGKKKGGWDSFLFPWAHSTKGFPFKDNFEMTISNVDKPNEYRVRFGGIGGENSNEHNVVDIPAGILLSVEWNPDPLPRAVKSPYPINGAPKSCVVAFTFGYPEANGSLTGNDQIKVYIRFVGPNALVGKAFIANWNPANDSENVWGDLVLAKD